MGRMVHHAVVAVIDLDVTSGAKRCGLDIYPKIDEFRRDLPEELKPCLVGPIPSAFERFEMLVWLPDGSKEGWPQSDLADEWRHRFIDLFVFRDAEDWSDRTPHHVVGVEFGPEVKYNFRAPHVTTSLG
jgi:hypothetical protein